MTPLSRGYPFIFHHFSYLMSKRENLVNINQLQRPIQNTEIIIFKIGPTPAPKRILNFLPKEIPKECLGGVVGTIIDLLT